MILLCLGITQLSPDLVIFVANDRLTKPIPLPLAHTRILHGGSACLAVYMYTYAHWKLLLGCVHNVIIPWISYASEK